MPATNFPPRQNPRSSQRFGDVMGSLPRAQHDWYVDQPEATEALLRVERFSGTSWDPACGMGNVPMTMQAACLRVVGTDLIDRGYRQYGEKLPPLDFLSCSSVPVWLPRAAAGVANIVSNPPYKAPILRAFVDRALGIASHKVAFLLPLTFLEGQRKASWLRSTPLARVHVFTWRLSMPPGELLLRGEVEPEGGLKCFAWFVWEHGWQGLPLVNLLMKEPPR
jgi:hypothetical protein